MVDASKVRGSGGTMLTDIVSLVRYALEQENELVPFHEHVDQRFAGWLAGQEQRGVLFTDEQRRWLIWMKENIAAEIDITPESFEYTPFAEHGGIGRATQVFGDQLLALTNELAEALAA
jgi:type I restriction enzyme R subunit